MNSRREIFNLNLQIKIKDILLSSLVGKCSDSSDIMVPSHSVIRSHKKKIESSPSMIFPQGMVTTKVLPSAHTISNLQQ